MKKRQENTHLGTELTVKITSTAVAGHKTEFSEITSVEPSYSYLRVHTCMLHGNGRDAASTSSTIDTLQIKTKTGHMLSVTSQPMPNACMMHRWDQMPVHMSSIMPIGHHDAPSHDPAPLKENASRLSRSLPPLFLRPCFPPNHQCTYALHRFLPNSLLPVPNKFGSLVLQLICKRLVVFDLKKKRRYKVHQSNFYLYALNSPSV